MGIKKKLKDFFIFNEELEIKIKVQCSNLDNYIKSLFIALFESSVITLKNIKPVHYKIFLLGLANNKVNIEKEDLHYDYYLLNPRIFYKQYKTEKFNKDDVSKHYEILEKIENSSSGVRKNSYLVGSRL